MFKHLLKQETARRRALAAGYLVANPSRCIQCGVCSYNCPLGIDIRHQVWRGLSIKDSYCLTCGECVARCPRGVLTFEKSNLFESELAE